MANASIYHPQPLGIPSNLEPYTPGSLDLEKLRIGEAGSSSGSSVKTSAIVSSLPATNHSSAAKAAGEKGGAKGLNMRMGLAGRYGNGNIGGFVTGYAQQHNQHVSTKGGAAATTIAAPGTSPPLPSPNKLYSSSSPS